jgi:serine protease Do
VKWLLLLIVSLGSFWNELPSLSLDFPPPGIGLAERGQTLSEPQVRQLARSITVEVLSGAVWGSGVPIERQSNTDTILPNRQVLGYQSSQGWQIQTPDGKIHRGKAEINHL